MGLNVVSPDPGSVQIEIQDLEEADRGWVRLFLEEQAGSARVVSRGRLHQADSLPGYVALASGTRVGLLTCHIVNHELEVVTLHTSFQRHGVGSHLMSKARDRAKLERCRRLWLITTNDNEPAIAFYKSLGMAFVATHRGAVAESRKLKPEIPMVGYGGKPIEDELEFELLVLIQGAHPSAHPRA
jgi:ribosomal protein S18 acetylase RimI-like enzyme